MDKEQAIEKLNDIRCHVKEISVEEQALVMAIDALKAQLFKEGTTSDLISRQAVINAIENTNAKMSMPEWDEITNAVMSLPTIQPEPQWIPVSERMPRDGTWNIFTDGKNISVERYKADAIDHFFPNGRWFQLEDVIAWMPLPEPYTK